MPCSRSASVSSHSADAFSAVTARRQSSARYEASLRLKATLSASTAERAAEHPNAASLATDLPKLSNTSLSIPEPNPASSSANAYATSPVRSPARASSMSSNRAVSVGGLVTSPSQRLRAHTSNSANGLGQHQINGSMANGTRSMRTSPQLRASSLSSLGPPLTTSGSAPGSVYGMNQASSPRQPHGPQWERHTADLTSCMIAFLSPILPTEEEYRIKEATRRQLERLANRISPGAKLLAFGSMANGFALRNSDMDLCCLIGDSDGQPPTTQRKSELVESLGQLIRQETDFTVMPLPKARIPIIKIHRTPTAALSYDIACDIGFENRLALENTRLLLSYAMVDPQRLRTLVLFVKVWAKRRKLNSPYTGTLSSYGYTLLVLYFLVHVKTPAVLPNLQRVPPTRPMRTDEMQLEGNNIYFYDDLASLRKQWSSHNTDNVGELLIDFFRYFSKEFSYSREVISLKSDSGSFSKDGVTWTSELCIEDPFSKNYNVSRTVTKDGLYTIRGEFMRATRMLTNMRGQKISSQLAELCEEREDSLSRAPDGHSPQRYHQLRPQFRDTYASPRRGDPSASSISGYGGSFAFEQMARGLGQGVAFPPTAAMLAPLSKSHGLSAKSALPSFAQRQKDAGFSSAQSDSGNCVGADIPHVGTGHASARSSPSSRHALPSGYPGSGTQEAFDYGTEISFRSDARHDQPSSTPRGKSSRSFSETLNRSKSLSRGDTTTTIITPSRPTAAQVHAAAMPVPAASTFYNPVTSQQQHHAQQIGQMRDFESSMSSLSVTRPTDSPRRLSVGSSATSSCAQYDSNCSSVRHCSSASSPWSLPGHTDDSRQQQQQAQPDTLALVHEYLRRSAALSHATEHEFDPHDNISEGTLDELARLSEIEDFDNDDTNSAPPSPPDTTKAQYKAIAASAAAAAAASGIARKHKQH